MQIVSLSEDLGFSTCRFTSAVLDPSVSSRLEEYVANGHHGTMAWMADTLARRLQPRAMWPEARTSITLAMNYGPRSNPLENLAHKQNATISVYAQNRDYHDIIKGRLKQIAQLIVSRTKCQAKVFVDTAPLLEKPLAQQAGIGWQGKHTNLVSREFGSWLFLGSILTSHVFEADEPETDHCGSCHACLDVCPTDAFPAPYQLDARRCISYLTIEFDGVVPEEFRVAMGNRIYGCDDCLAVCPWNKFAQTASEIKLIARPDLQSPELMDLVALDDAAFRAKFYGSPIKRIGHKRFIRNVLIAIGNSNSQRFVDVLKAFLANPDNVIRATAVWAFSRLATREEFISQRSGLMRNETEPLVLQEWQNASENTGETN